MSLILYSADSNPLALEHLGALSRVVHGGPEKVARYLRSQATEWSLFDLKPNADPFMIQAAVVEKLSRRPSCRFTLDRTISLIDACRVAEECSLRLRVLAEFKHLSCHSAVGCDDRPLDDLDIAILQAVKTYSPKAMISQICGRVALGERLVRPKLISLMKGGLVDLSAESRFFYLLTGHGQERLTQISE